MKLLASFGLVAVIIAPTVFAPAPAFAQPSPAALDQVQQHLRAASTMTANFVQTDGRGQTRNGHLSIKRPDKLRIQYARGGMLVVASGGRLNLIDYDGGRQDSWPVRESPLSMLVDPNFDFRGTSRVIRNDENTLLIQVRSPTHPELGRMTLGFAKIASAPGGLSLQGWVAIDGQNNRTQVRLSGQRYNVSVADDSFDYQPLPPRAQRPGQRTAGETGRFTDWWLVDDRPHSAFGRILTFADLGNGSIYRIHDKVTINVSTFLQRPLDSGANHLHSRIKLDCSARTAEALTTQSFAVGGRALNRTNGDGTTAPAGSESSIGKVLDRVCFDRTNTFVERLPATELPTAYARQRLDR